MPEILEVEAARAVLGAHALDREIARVHAPDTWFLKRGTTPAALRHALIGNRFTGARRTGKQILLDTADPDTRLGVHLGMSGRVLVDDEEAGDPLIYASNRRVAKWNRFGVHFADGGSFMLRDPRRLGAAELDPDESRFGPDALTITARQLDAGLGTRTAPIKAVLMDQARVAGLGNLLVDEVLWRAGIDPTRPAVAIGTDERRGLHKPCARLSACSAGAVDRIRETCRAISTSRARVMVRPSSGARSAGERRTPARRTNADRRSVGLVRARRPAIVAGLLAVAVLLAACGSGTKPASPTTTTGSTGSTPNAPISKTLGTGVTATTIKIGIALVDFKCIASYIQTTRVDEYKVYDAFIANINAHGGIAGRKIVPVFHTFCPIVPAPALALCTQFTEDDHVFAVMGDFIDLTGQAQPCIAKQHNTVLITIDLTQAIINSATPGLLLTFDANQERTVGITLELLKHEHALDGKKVAVLGEATTEASVRNVLAPGLKKMGVNLGDTGILTIAGADTAAASAQMQSFIERWKTEGVNTIFLSGLQVSAQQFVPDLVKAMPGVQLIADNNTVGSYGQNLQKADKPGTPNPYDGIIAANGLGAHDYDRSANWKYCAAIYEKYFHKKAPDQETVVPGPNGHTLDINGAITDSCTELTMFHDIATRVGTYLNNANWVNVVNNYGKIRDMQSLYGSLHTGKYDADDTFALVAFDPKIPPEGNWRYLTKVEDVTG